MTEENNAKSEWGGSRYARHGIHRYLESGQLPDRLQGFTGALKGELLSLVGNDPRFEPMAGIAASRMTVCKLAENFLEFTFDKGKSEGKSIREIMGELSGVLRIYNSYLEGSRRDLDALLLTPSAARRLLNPESLEEKHREIVEVGVGQR